MSKSVVEKPKKNVSLSEAYLQLAAAKRNKDLPAITAAEEVIKAAQSKE